MSELKLRTLVKGYVELQLNTKEFRIVSTEDQGDHWKVLVKCRDDLTKDWSRRHQFAIGHDGRLIWDHVC